MEDKLYILTIGAKTSYKKKGRIQFDVVCTVHHSTICIRTNKMHRFLVIRLYFPLDALHVSDYISPSSGATL